LTQNLSPNGCTNIITLKEITGLLCIFSRKLRNKGLWHADGHKVSPQA